MPRRRGSGMGWETRECGFDAETRRRGDRRGEATRKRERVRRQRRNVAFGTARSGFRRENEHRESEASQSREGVLSARPVKLVGSSLLCADLWDRDRKSV